MVLTLRDNLRVRHFVPDRRLKRDREILQREKADTTINRTERQEETGGEGRREREIDAALQKRISLTQVFFIPFFRATDVRRSDAAPYRTVPYRS